MEPREPAAALGCFEFAGGGYPSKDTMETQAVSNDKQYNEGDTFNDDSLLDDATLLGLYLETTSKSSLKRIKTTKAPSTGSEHSSPRESEGLGMNEYRTNKVTDSIADMLAVKPPDNESKKKRKHRKKKKDSVSRYTVFNEI
jgi:hypothetical protein